MSDSSYALLVASQGLRLLSGMQRDVSCHLTKEVRGIEGSIREITGAHRLVGRRIEETRRQLDELSANVTVAKALAGIVREKDLPRRRRPRSRSVDHLAA